MDGLKILKENYRPIQPSVKAWNNDISYTEIFPDEELQDFIYCFWQLKTNRPLDQPFVYRVVSDGCIDIFFNNKVLTENFVMGFCRKYTEFPIGNDFDYIGIRFLPTAFPLLFNVDAKSLSNQTKELKDILPQISLWIKNQLRPSQTIEELLDPLNTKMKELIESSAIEYDYRLYQALRIIFNNNGFLDIEKDLEAGISPRQLRRIFNYYLGTTPKAFCNVVRFQHILNAKPSNESLKENRIYYDVGFFDQAHFIKNFKTFYGITPSEAFG